MTGRWKETLWRGLAVCAVLSGLAATASPALAGVVYYNINDPDAAPVHPTSLANGAKSFESAGFSNLLADDFVLQPGNTVFDTLSWEGALRTNSTFVVRLYENSPQSLPGALVTGGQWTLMPTVMDLGNGAAQFTAMLPGASGLMLADSTTYWLSIAETASTDWTWSGSPTGPTGSFNFAASTFFTNTYFQLPTDASNNSQYFDFVLSNSVMGPGGPGGGGGPGSGQVPEPGSVLAWSLLLLGGVFQVVRRRRR